LVAAGRIIVSNNNKKQDPSMRATSRLIAHDIFLDGNTWEASHSVNRKPLVYDQTVGFGFNWKQLDINVSYVYRSEQYSNQAGPTRFGSFVLTWRPNE